MALIELARFFLKMEEQKYKETRLLLKMQSHWTRMGGEPSGGH